jgi:hypothetical protein
MIIKLTLKTLFVVLLCALSMSSFAQKRETLTDEDRVQEEVTKEISLAFQNKDFLKKKDKKFADVKGYIVIDIGVVQNGKVSTFFKVDTDIKSIDFFEYISDYILSYKFNFKLPKQQKYKVRQTIEF